MTCRSGADDSNNVIGDVFGDEINRVLNMFAEYRFHAVTYVPFCSLLRRDLGRYEHLISAMAFNN